MPGGIVTYANLVPNRTFCADQFLTRVGFLDFPSANAFLASLRKFGLTHHNVDEGPDVGVLHQDEGLLGPARWLQWGSDEHGHPIAWLTGTDPGKVMVPQGWSPDSALRYVNDADASRMIPVQTTNTHTAFLDSRSGEVVYGLPPTPTPDPFRAFEFIGQFTDQLRLVRDEVGPIYLYYFPKSSLRVIAQSLRLADQPDFNKYALRLQDLREVAAGCVRESKKAFDIIEAATIESDIKESARLAYLQVFYDGTWVIAFSDYVTAMRAGSPQAKNYFSLMADFSHRARVNLTDSKRAVAALNRKYK